MDSFLRDLMSYAEWANAVYFSAWGKSPARDNEELRARAGHIVGVQEGFISILNSLPPKEPPEGPPATFDDLKTRAEKSHLNLREYVSRADSEALARTLTVPWFPDPPCVITTSEALVQVAMHTQHHRGQCMTRLKALGGETKNVDWIIWLWKQKPQARW
jgi:uncharacterized damage-inducible protein DinB